MFLICERTFRMSPLMSIVPLLCSTTSPNYSGPGFTWFRSVCRRTSLTQPLNIRIESMGKRCKNLGYSRAQFHIYWQHPDRAVYHALMLKQKLHPFDLGWRWDSRCRSYAAAGSQDRTDFDPIVLMSQWLTECDCCSRCVSAGARHIDADL